MQLTPIAGERRVYALEDIGALRLSGWGSRSATAEARGLTWRITHHGMLQPVIRATDAAGAVVGEFRGRTLARGGSLRWSGREFALRPDSRWHERYVLVDGERTLATIAGGGWGKRTVKVSGADPDAMDHGLLLFAVFVVETLAQNARAAAPIAA